MRVHVHFGEQGSREVAQIFELVTSSKGKGPLLFDKVVSYRFG